MTKTNIGFALGTGRCGTKFLHRIMSREPGVASVHERNPLNETFHRYCKWNDLQVDDEGFLISKQREIERDLRKNKFSFEASAYLSLSVRELYDRFRPCFVLLVRSPERIINSYLRKGWYRKPIVRKDALQPIGYQEEKEFHHFLGRIIPAGKEYRKWQNMTRVGKLAWYWRALNMEVMKQFKNVPDTHWRVQRLEDLNFGQYRELASFLGFSSKMSSAEYNRIAGTRPNAFSNLRTIEDWSGREIQEFESEISQAAKIFGYPTRFSEYRIPPRRRRTLRNMALGLAGSVKQRIVRR